MSKSETAGLALGLLLLIGVADYETGHDLNVWAFYMLPVCWAAQEGGRKVGVVMALAATLTWLTADSMTGYVYHYPLVLYWNALMVFLFLVSVVYWLTSFQQAKEELEETIKLRTDALKALQAEIEERKRLETANLRAEQLALVGKMAAQVAHEVRNPLGSITLNLDLIRKEIEKLGKGDGNSVREGRTLIEEMRAEADRISRIIEDYLRFARLPKLRRQRVDLNAFLEQKLGFVSAELERAKVELKLHLEAALPPLNVGADQLWQATLNLIRNSCDAMPMGGVLTISTLREGGQVVLRVCDNGVGMSQEQRQQVFVPFFTTKKEGLGLGMALVEQIVANHGGRIECESAEGKGTTFSIFLSLEGQL